MSSNSLCHLLVLNSHRVVEIHIFSVSCNKNQKESLNNDPLTTSNSHYFISKIICSRWTVKRNKKPCSLFKLEHSSTGLQQGLQISSNSLCHGLVLKSHRVVEIQIQASLAKKMKTVDGL